MDEGVSKKIYNACRASNLWLNIGYDGDAYLCCETKHKKDFLLGNIKKNELVEIIKQSNVERRIEKIFPAGRCPTSLCKPSALNLLFDEIEKKRSEKDGKLPDDTLKWLNLLRTYGKTASNNVIIPSVSGIYDDAFF